MTTIDAKKILQRMILLKQGGAGMGVLMQLLERIEFIKGDRGEKGEKGDRGPMGPVGRQGAPGPIGPQGDDGPEGKRGERGPEGKQGPAGPRGPEGARGTQGPEGKQGPAGSPDKPADIKRKLESLEDEDRLDASAIKNLPTVFRETPQISVFGGGGGAGARLTVLADGVPLGQDIRKINFIGSGFTSGVRQSDGVVTLEFTGGGVGASQTTEVPTGTVDDSNLDFVFSEEPFLIVVNHMTYRKNSGWTWSGSTATLSSPVGSGGDIFGIMQ